MTATEIIVAILGALGGLGGIGAFIKVIFFTGAERKGMEIENEGKVLDNESKEISEYRKLIDTLQESLIKQSEYYEKLIKAQIIRADEHEKRVYDKFAEVYKIINGLKAENENYKESIAEAYHCPYPNKVEDCPAISKWNLLTNSCSECSHNKHND